MNILPTLPLSLIFGSGFHAHLSCLLLPLLSRSLGGSGRVRGVGPRVRPSAVRLHAGPWRHLHHLAVLVPHPLPVRHAVRERRGGGGLLLLRRHQGHLPARAVRAARQHPPAARMQGRRGGHDGSGQVGEGEEKVQFSGFWISGSLGSPLLIG